MNDSSVIRSALILHPTAADSMSKRDSGKIIAMGWRELFRKNVAAFMLVASACLALAKCAADNIGRTQAGNDAAALWGAMRPMMEFLAQQPVVSFWLGLVFIALIAALLASDLNFPIARWLPRQSGITVIAEPPRPQIVLDHVSSAQATDGRFHHLWRVRILSSFKPNRLVMWAKPRPPMNFFVQAPVAVSYRGDFTERRYAVEMVSFPSSFELIAITSDAVTPEVGYEL